MLRSLLASLVVAPIALACVPVDSSAPAGPRPPLTGQLPPAGQPPAGQPPAAASNNCDSVRAEARRILQTSCAPCHQDPANQANFSFCLDVDRLATSVSSTGKKFVAPGFPEQSRIYERIANGEMPPAVVTQRLSGNDLSAIRQWITTCVALGTGGFGNLDAGVGPAASPEPDPGPGCGKARQPCCTANTCESGGCCVLGYCRANGQVCTGGPGGDNIPGTCANGSCVTAGVPCGNLNQACCGVVRSCTAAHAVCPPGGMTCQACGQANAPCCRNGGLSTCLDGLGCVNNAYPNPGYCTPCGSMGQACCGDGPAARRTCTAPLVCRYDAGIFACGR